MDYKKIYNNIIDNRKSNPISTNVYSEIHHILPRSLGGDDSSDNLIRLSAREHFICHALLAEMFERYSFEWYKMNHAFMLMRASTSKQERYFNSRLYELKRNDFSKTMSKAQSGTKNSQFGKKWITDGICNTRINNDTEIPYGWVLGRTLKKKEKIKIDNNIYYLDKIINLQMQRKLFNIFGRTDVKSIHELLHEMYINKSMSTNDIAKLYNTNNESVRNYLKFFNIKLRTLSESINLFNKNAS